MKTKKVETTPIVISTTVKIVHETFGVILKETFINPVQMKLFLKAVNGCFLTQGDLTFFNGDTFFLHVPYNVLKNSVISTSTENHSASEIIKLRSELEMKVD
jgi:hypothetical protein